MPSRSNTGLALHFLVNIPESNFQSAGSIARAEASQQPGMVDESCLLSGCPQQRKEEDRLAPSFSHLCSVQTLRLRGDGATHIQGVSPLNLLSHMPIISGTTSKIHPEVCFAAIPGVCQSNRVNNRH